MPEFIEMNMGSGKVLVEAAASDNRTVRSGPGENIIKKFDKALDTVLQHQIVDHCKILAGAFEQLKEQPIHPQKATAEFGLQFNGEGNIYVTKVGAQASFKVSFEWEFPEA
ncbi:MAG: hypothetical protein GY765_16115 [bacterium]|nr:hypothetical protein [bacterium]